MSQFVVTNFYKFVNLDPLDLKLRLLRFLSKCDIKGTVLVAPEGINAGLTGNRSAVTEFYDFIHTIPGLDDLAFKESFVESPPFNKLKIKIKKEIVTFNVPTLNMSERGQYLTPQQWDEFLERSHNAIVIDTRNDYEVQFGTFKDALDPKIKKFSEFGTWVDRTLSDADKDKDILMFCTGGIRCEKTTAYLKQKGFKKVYHLMGGILQYLQETQNRKSHWTGRCFVFDDRVSLNYKLGVSQ
ncbi:hypothetical protein EDM53_05600 [Rickettsiales endosymbiont of Peranema trichophorum]|uniref:oxygen-dependent tRNA uridine(34) hydroxylase TrhO n=1 Tax=Rickettsiales endosymbiont of Peranema trichophorum TaxID=2486577 RepID=UPI001023AEF3|nr:rhodanese-like domain-containing protein [Rickettsiales endosymbiont of Peranema trichophorum]RZI45254.1 hypothetical protein EDM53_05600 [Rickettsiales endosymbiont of Peranema trichophorum]